MPVSRKVLSHVWSDAANHCARCQMYLCATNEDGSSILTGEVCHIRAQKPGGPRYDPSISASQLHSYDNLIVLCPGCHKCVDDQPERFTVEVLTKTKKDHIEAVRGALKRPEHQPLQINTPATTGIDDVLVEIGTLSSNWGNIEESYIHVRFRGALMAKHDVRYNRGYDYYELYRLRTGSYAVYMRAFDGETVRAYLFGIDAESEYQEKWDGFAMSLVDLQDKFPAVAAKAGLPRTLIR